MTHICAGGARVCQDSACGEIAERRQCCTGGLFFWQAGGAPSPLSGCGVKCETGDRSPAPHAILIVPDTIT